MFPFPTSAERLAVAAVALSRGGVQRERPTVLGTGYRLDFAGDPRLAASSSGTVVS